MCNDLKHCEYFSIFHSIQLCCFVQLAIECKKFKIPAKEVGSDLGVKRQLVEAMSVYLSFFGNKFLDHEFQLKIVLSLNEHFDSKSI